MRADPFTRDESTRLMTPKTTEDDNDDAELTRYVLNHYGWLMTTSEARINRAIGVEHKADAAQSEVLASELKTYGKSPSRMMTLPAPLNAVLRLVDATSGIGSCEFTPDNLKSTDARDVFGSSGRRGPDNASGAGTTGTI